MKKLHTTLLMFLPIAIMSCGTREKGEPTVIDKTVAYIKKENVYGDIRLNHANWEGTISSTTGITNQISLSLLIPEIEHQTYDKDDYSKSAFSQMTSEDMLDFNECSSGVELTHVNEFEFYEKGKSTSPLKDRIFITKHIYVDDNIKEDAGTNKRPYMHNVLNYFQPLTSENLKGKHIILLAELKNNSRWVGGLFLNVNNVQFTRFADVELSPSIDQSSGIQPIDKLNAKSDLFSFEIIEKNGMASSSTCWGN